jgi:ribosomal protein L11 methyltransferase
MKPAKMLWCLSIATSLEAEDAVAELAGSMLGQPAAAYYDLERRVSRVSVYCEQKIPATQFVKIAAGLQQIKRCGLDVRPAKITLARVKREDWAESWKKHFPPITIGNALLVKPSWSRRRLAKGQAVVILDPGLSFGTGQHPTTAFCLTELVRGRAARPGQSFLDIGTGSGILAISAAKLGYLPVHAFDFDPDCVRIARENARTNDVAGTIKITRGDVARLNLKPARRFDLVCANLISNLLLAERRKIVSQVSADGMLVLAGILRKEFSLVQKGFAEIGWDFFRGKTVNEWRSGTFRRR